MIETPLFLQSVDPLAPIEYTANDLRRLLDAVFPDEGVPLARSGELLVTQRAAGANMSVDVAPGYAVIDGDDAAAQGRYLAPITALENVPIPAAPGANSRIDSIVLRVRDPQAGGDPGEDAILEVVSGAAAAVPIAPAIPDTAVELARVTVAAGTLAITNAMVTDRRVTPELALGQRAVILEKLIGEETTSATSYTTSAAPTANVVIGSSGKLLLLTSAQIRGASATMGQGYLGLAMSGANVRAVGDADAGTLSTNLANGESARVGKAVLIVGLAPGLTTFTEQFKTTTPATTAFYNRHHVLIPL